VITDPSRILGVQGAPGETYSWIPWRRVGHPSCGWGNLSGPTLKDTILNYHRHGIRVLLTVCQPPNDKPPIDIDAINDAAQGKADAVQCGNEEMKVADDVPFLYVKPEIFARFYDLCERAVHAVRRDIPVLMGSLDPHVGGIDTALMWHQVQYLDEMQVVMNRKVHPGGKWRWSDQTVGLIDTWHNGYPDENTNSLYQLFRFWAERFKVPMNQLGKHLWVVEGTGCFKGCGIDPNDPYEVAIVHVLALITNVKTAMRYGIPHFFFSGKDFILNGILWPLGVLDLNGNPKPIRQDLPMGARTLTMSCHWGRVAVRSQVELLAALYASCSLPDNYVDILES
jgi:hypothetical protein